VNPLFAVTITLWTFSWDSESIVCSNNSFGTVALNSLFLTGQ